MGIMLNEKTLILAKAEVTYATDPTPTTAADAVLVSGVELEIKREPEPQGDMDVTLSPLQKIMGMGEAKITFTVDKKGSGTAGTPADWMSLHAACGWSIANSAGVSDTLTPDDTPTGSVTIYCFKDGLQYILVGCRGEVTEVYEAGKLVKMNYELFARFDIPTDVTFPTAVTLDSTKPVPALGLAFTFGSYSAIIDKLEFGLKNEIPKNEDMNATYGVESFDIVKRDPAGTMSVNAILRATSNADFWAYMNSGVPKALAMALGTAAGNIFNVTAPVCVVLSIKPTNKNGIEMFEIALQFARNTGADEIQQVAT